MEPVHHLFLTIPNLDPGRRARFHRMIAEISVISTTTSRAPFPSRGRKRVEQRNQLQKELRKISCVMWIPLKTMETLDPGNVNSICLTFRKLRREAEKLMKTF
ncbi:MAG TPA: hypothetical protein VFM25_13585 [Verrucomicrobiae bacterium]|nr:hypothetical protein [Verrucomicrobiae bacterium]